MTSGNGLPPLPRTPQAIIDQAIQENKGSASLCYLLILLFVIGGFFVLIWGACHGQGIVSLSGAVTSGLFWPALNNARSIREKNMAIRLLELTMAGAQQTAAMLRDVYRDVFARRKRREKIMIRFRNPFVAKHSWESVLVRIVEGLENGSVVLPGDDVSADDTITISPEEVLKWAHDDPFAPFRIVTKDNVTFEVRQPDAVMISDLSVVIGQPSSRNQQVFSRCEVVALNRVARLERGEIKFEPH